MVIRCPAPWRVTEPRPAEAWIPDPSPGAVRLPSRDDSRWHPDGPIPFSRPPRPVLIELGRAVRGRRDVPRAGRLEEHTSELQSLRHLVCRLLLEKKKKDVFCLKKKNKQQKKIYKTTTNMTHKCRNYTNT